MMMGIAWGQVSAFALAGIVGPLVCHATADDRKQFAYNKEAMARFRPEMRKFYLTVSPRLH